MSLEWLGPVLRYLILWNFCKSDVSIGDRVQMLLQHQPLRSRLIHLLRSAKPHVWAIESVVALLASLPSDAAAPGSDGGNYASAVLFGFLGQLSEPLAEGQSVETHAEVRKISFHQINYLNFRGRCSSFLLSSVVWLQAQLCSARWPHRLAYLMH